MTTNVFDGLVGLVATDSRWSIQRGRWLMYIDETNFDKIEVVGDTALMFAGRGHLIEKWKLWLRSSPADMSGSPEVDGVSINGFNIPAKEKRFSEGMSLSIESSIFAGSGAPYARACWNSNRDAKKSIETAKGADYASGGSVKFFDFVDRGNNLGGVPFGPTTINGVDEAILLRGNIMDISTSQRPGVPFKFSEIAASAEGALELQDIKRQIESGELSANAPCDALYGKWSEDSKAKLEEFLGEVFDWKK